MSKDLQVSYRPIDEIVPYARNARSHSKGQIKQLTASINSSLVLIGLPSGGGCPPVLIHGHWRAALRHRRCGGSPS